MDVRAVVVLLGFVAQSKDLKAFDRGVLFQAMASTKLSHATGSEAFLLASEHVSKNRHFLGIPKFG